MNHDLVVYQFSRSKVEAGDFSHFLSVYGREELPTGRKLREMMNTLTFVIEGFDADPREVHTIPEIRRFYAAFREAWPYWLYFCNLDTDELRTMVLCCLPSISALKVDHKRLVKVELDHLELLKFLRANFGPMNTMCVRGEMFESLIYARTKAIFEYFELPFDVPPP
jgi:hypothetical protein